MDVKKNEVLKKLQRYCSLQDRSVQKVREKLYRYSSLSQREKNEIIQTLLDDSYLDDKRFTENFVRSKVNQNKWGRNKIIQGLFRHKIDELTIEVGIKGIDEEKYQSNLIKLTRQKSKTNIDREKLIRYLIQRGYDYEEIISIIS
ncbi:regulatory protein RecX [Membranihabitans maritimus]|uniref:regulatory protein RecX n=1 Tax=Membranihabitans maritimus TaxID=2904244 RepID=UPI001F37F2A3|nr:regulatory protein RecX [Membranihabitans maritimus]